MHAHIIKQFVQDWEIGKFNWLMKTNKLVKRIKDKPTPQ